MYVSSLYLQDQSFCSSSKFSQALFCNSNQIARRDLGGECVADVAAVGKANLGFVGPGFECQEGEGCEFDSRVVWSTVVEEGGSI